jgi:putative transposase
MNRFYELAGTTKQSHLAACQRRLGLEDKWLLMCAILGRERAKHPAMSLKKLYHKLQPGFVGRDAFVDFGMENGFEPVLKFKKPKTSRSPNQKTYQNLLYDLKIVDINQVWVTDITYFKVKGKWYYISMVIDLYSRRVIGFKVAKSMHAQASLDALQMALDFRGIPKYRGRLRHHSDRGTQYTSTGYVGRLENYEIRISMGHSCFDNLYMESSNGILKNEYLIHRDINTFEDLILYVKNDINYYNTERPHGSLDYMTPVEFECYISNIPLELRPFLDIFTSKFRKNNLLLVEPDNQQLKLKFPKW